MKQGGIKDALPSLPLEHVCHCRSHTELAGDQFQSHPHIYISHLLLDQLFSRYQFDPYGDLGWNVLSLHRLICVLDGQPSHFLRMLCDGGMHFAVHDSGTAILDGIESNDADLALLPGGRDGFDGTQSHHVIAGEHGLYARVSLQYVLKDIEPLVSFPICGL